MKHNLKITIFLISMFVLTQLIGLFVVGHYSQESNQLPYGMTPPEPEQETDFLTSFLPSIIIAFIIAIAIMFLLTKVNAEWVLRIWFFVVVIIALGISINSFLPPLQNSAILAVLIALPLAYIKLFKRDFYVHNLTEFFIYPGIAAVFVPLLNILTVIILLLLISGYDMWAVWRSGIMQKMAKYQMNKLKVFAGFFVPYLPRKTKQKIKKMKKSELKKKKVKVNMAILGGGDIVFPIIAAGVAMLSMGIGTALLVILGAASGLAYLLLTSEKKKFYPAMPFITSGILLGFLLGWIIF